jgi:hypothetical protein
MGVRAFEAGPPLEESSERRADSARGSWAPRARQAMLPYCCREAVRYVLAVAVPAVLGAAVRA